MIIALSTRWNAGRHTDGEAMLEEIRGMGFDHVELGYDLRMDLVLGVQKMVREKMIGVHSVHNYCPVPVGAPQGHPELYTLASTDPKIREGAVLHTMKTARFAADLGARVVIVHAGNVEMERFSNELCGLYEKGEAFGPRYEKVKMKLQVVREKKVRKQMEYLRAGLDRLLPMVAETGVRIALENLPTWEAIPTEFEMETLCRDYAAHGLAYWHDIGHAQIRQNLGFISQERWLERLAPYLAGMHIHDVIPPAGDHRMPPVPNGVDFPRLKSIANRDIIRVIEAAPQTPKEKIVEALSFLRQAWESAESPETKA